VALSAASAVASAARTPATALVRAEVFVGPDATVFGVAGFRLLRVFSEYLGIDTTTDRGDADTPKRLRRENVESSPPVAVPGSVPRVGSRGGCVVDGWD
jgi:hypothetical protein